MEHEVEQEIKILDIDKDSLIDRIVQKGGKKHLETSMTIYTYDICDTTKIDHFSIGSSASEVLENAYNFFQKHGSLAENNAHLRLRFLSHAPEAVELTFKYTFDTHSDSSHVKKAHEYTCHLSQSDALKTRDLLQDMGFLEVAAHEKKRLSYTLPNGCVCDIDTYPNIPTYVELEGDDNVIDEAIDKLELDRDKRSLLSGNSFFATYGVNYYSKLYFEAQ